MRTKHESLITATMQQIIRINEDIKIKVEKNFKDFKNH